MTKRLAHWSIWFWRSILKPMKRIVFFLLATLSLAACKKDESVAAYDGGNIWQLYELDRAPFTARATLLFDEGGKVSGQGPCNSFFAEQTKPYPWIGIEKIGATRMACPDLQLESTYFDALAGMTLAEVSGDVLILSNDAGRQMLFRAMKDGG